MESVVGNGCRRMPFTDIFTFILHVHKTCLSGKESACNAGATGDTGSIPGSGRSPGERHSNPLHCSCLENALYRGAWWATVHGVAKSQTQLKQFGMHAWNTCFPESRLLDMIGYHNKIPQTEKLKNNRIYFSQF